MRTRNAIAVAAAAAGVALGLVAPRLETDADDTSFSVTGSSYVDSVLNPPRGEDTDFFVNTGGVPNVMFLLDTSGSMRRLPPDGAAQGWGAFEPTTNGTEGAGYGCSNTYANALVFHSPCGTTTLDGAPYDGASDFAEAKDPALEYCPHMVAGNQAPATDKPGFDPDFYPTFFARDSVYHDTSVDLSPADDGWTDAAPNAASTSVATFCGQFADATKSASCNTCLATRGYWFDGSYDDFLGAPSCATSADCAQYGYGSCVKDSPRVLHVGNNDNTAHCRLPDVWFSGNFLNFHPPKFIVARKALKDVLMSVRKFRLGLTVLDSAGDGGKLLEKLNPACNLVGSPSSFDSNRSAIKNAINNPLQVTFSGAAPLAEALLDIGQLYRNPGPAGYWFGAAHTDAAFESGSKNQASVCFSCQASAVLVITDGAPTHDGWIPGPLFAASPMTEAVASLDATLAGMAGYNITGIGATDCPACNTTAEAADTTVASGQCTGQQTSGACNGLNQPIPSYLPKVAWYLKNVDFRRDGEEGADGFPMAGDQTLTTYTIGLGALGNTAQLLRHTAEAGGGLYNGVDPKAGGAPAVTDVKALRDAILRVLEDVNTRSTSFGAASVSTLQSAATQGVLVPRFEPSRSAHWDGHLYAFDLYSEFTGDEPPCVPRDKASSGPANGDYDCDGRCTSVFLKDADGDFIQEDGTGAFKKNTPRNRAACGYGNLCADCADADPNADAAAKWDAGRNLSPVLVSTDAVTGEQVIADNPSYRAWTQRKIYTVVDSSGDRKLDSADPVVEVSDANALAIMPYLNLRGRRVCSGLAERLTTAENPAGPIIATDVASGDYESCAKVILQFVRGADVFNERGCTEWAAVKASAGLPTGYCTRRYQLGDIFHSSPIEVWPPLPSTGYLCPRGLHPQCLPSLFSRSIPNPSAGTNANAYDDYAKHDTYRLRQKFALVGANDGMLHAITTGVWRKADDNRTTPDEGKPPYEGFHEDRPSLAPANTIGYELWGFIPPDLLPKLHLLLEGTHHFFVDGTPMVRDVWMDGGTPNQTGNTTNANGIREGTEFHTIAVVGERRGGTHYFALDVTDAGGDLDGKPRFLWLYPQPDDPESLAFGETYVEFVPKPPPIGPVRIDAGAPPCAGNRQEFATAAGATRCFEERWVVFLNGGFDPQYTKGRGVHMVDVATGEEVWDFSQPPGAASACDATQDPRCNLHYPVAASVAMMMWGKEANFLSAAALDGYFDTATFGDTGGQLWVLRFSDPGVIDGTTKKVNNWYGARIFQHGKSSALSCGLNYCKGQPFFYITSNLPLQANGLFRVLAGTGDRYNLLDPVGGVCSPDNLRACIQKGCTVELESATGGAGATYGVEPLLGTQTYRADHPAACSGYDTTTYAFTATAPSGTSATAQSHAIDRLLITCPSTTTCSKSAETTTKRVSVDCNAAGSCAPTALNDSGGPIDLKGNADLRNWFFSVLVFDKVGDRRIFHDLPGAKLYDAARLSEDDLVDINAYDRAPATNPLATADGLGWRYYFDHGEPSTVYPWTVSLNGIAYDRYRTDERNASVSAVEASCTFWNTMQTMVPRGAWDATTECPVNSPCKASRTQLSFLYGAAPGTGGLCLNLDGQLTRFQQNESLVPPHIGKLVAYVSSGQVSFGLTSVRIPQGGSNVALGEVQDISSPTEWLPLDRETHDCRHASKDGAAPTNCK